MALNKSWKTTAVGVGGAILQGGGALLSNGSLNWRDYVNMAVMVLLGTLAKDFNVSGSKQ